MKTTIKTSASNSLEYVMIKPQADLLPFGSGYLGFLTRAASFDEEEPAGATRMQQPLRYLMAVEPMAEATLARNEMHRATRAIDEAPSLREAVIALREKILAS